MAIEYDENDREEILARGKYIELDIDGAQIESMFPVSLRIANAFPISVWKFMKIGLWICLGVVIIAEVYFLGQITLHYLGK